MGYPMWLAFQRLLCKSSGNLCGMHVFGLGKAHEQKSKLKMVDSRKQARKALLKKLVCFVLFFVYTLLSSDESPLKAITSAYQLF
ncbi:hypothetical protein VNO78_20682 [Psophocarpus tetragonolobus]|uniref:Uncharacterized protein n=1 Tax=Psophocarpus tetragonolobus TaxID=3891 RepID=A0AAN9SAQ6_PSOTE